MSLRFDFPKFLLYLKLQIAFVYFLIIFLQNFCCEFNIKEAQLLVAGSANKKIVVEWQFFCSFKMDVIYSATC